MPSLGIAPSSGGCTNVFSSDVAEPAPVPGVFPADVNFHLLEIGLQAIQLSPYHRAPRSTAPDAWARPAVFWHALVPFPFRVQVSHQAQGPPSESLPAMPGMQLGASWRTRSARSCPGPEVVRAWSARDGPRGWHTPVGAAWRRRQSRYRHKRRGARHAARAERNAASRRTVSSERPQR